MFFLLGGAFFEIIRDRFPPASRPRIPLFRTRTSYESIRLWCIDFGPKFDKRLRRRHGGFGDTFHVDEVFVKIRGKQHYLWRAVDQDGDVIDVFLQDRREAGAAKRFFRRLILRHGDQPWKVITDKLGSYRVAHRELVPDSFHVTYRYANNRAEQSHEATRFRERGMRRFKKRCPGATLPGSTFSGIRPVQFGSSFGQSQPLSGFETPRLCVLDSDNGSLINRGAGSCRPTDINLSIPLKVLARPIHE